MSPEEIKALRLSLNLTQEDLAHKIGITVSTLNRWENARIRPSRLSLKTLTKLARLEKRRAKDGR